MLLFFKSVNIIFTKHKNVELIINFSIQTVFFFKKKISLFELRFNKINTFR